MEETDLEPFERYIELIQSLQHIGDGMWPVPLTRHLPIAKAHLGHILNRKGTQRCDFIVENGS